MFPFKYVLEKQRKQELLTFQKNAVCKFKNISLLDIAFHHRSFSNEHSDFPINNERLEFLGDSVLGMIVAAELYLAHPEKPEGDLAKIKAAVVSEDSLFPIALNLNIDKYLMLGHGEEVSGGRKKKALLADALEALIGALYLDSGFKVVQRFVLKIIEPQMQLVEQNKHRYRDYKSLLQEYVQKKYRIIPKYLLVETHGPDHDRVFQVRVVIKDKEYEPALGKSKKEAEQAAAEIAWKALSLQVRE
ncbi:ribonuclease III [Treponema vincentii]|uniref:ribonuclease III n=1 Tax=Treponema vincentii TaxID=69710 RepID=UPI003D8C584D